MGVGSLQQFIFPPVMWEASNIIADDVEKSPINLWDWKYPPIVGPIDYKIHSSLMLKNMSWKAKVAHNNVSIQHWTVKV